MFAYSRIEYEYEIMNDLLEKEMLRQQKIAVQAISTIVHFDTKSFSRILAYAWLDSQADAINLADKLNLSKLDFLAIQEDLDGFKDEYLNNYEDQNF